MSVEIIDWKKIEGGREKYQAYLASREWAERRNSIKSRCNNTFEHCGNNPVESIHHLTYARIYKEPLNDLLGTCGTCHKYLSGKYSIPSKFNYYVFRPLTEEHVNNYIDRFYKRLNNDEKCLSVFKKMIFCVKDFIFFGKLEFKPFLLKNNIVIHAHIGDGLDCASIFISVRPIQELEPGFNVREFLLEISRFEACGGGYFYG